MRLRCIAAVTGRCRIELRGDGLTTQVRLRAGRSQLVPIARVYTVDPDDRKTRVSLSPS